MEEQTLDPRIKLELEKLNSATDEINKVEKELDEARTLFRHTLSESSSRLNVLLKKHKRSIEKSRDYFQSAALARKTQTEAQQAAVQFRRANSFYKAAKETIHLAELRLNETGADFDEAWQEMLNHSTIKMMDAEKEKMRSELEHHRKSQKFQELESKLNRMEKSHKKTILNAKPYYDLKAKLEIQLQQQKQHVDDLQKLVSESKAKYKSAMVQLEKISEEIHEQRQFLTLPIREPGVGCESDEEFPTEINLEKHLDFEASGSDDCISTDNSSIWSCESNTLSSNYNPDVASLNSDDIDSAFCSPNSLSLDRKFADALNLNTYSTEITEENLVPHLNKVCSPIIEAQNSQETLDSVKSSDTMTEERFTDSEEIRRGRTGTIIAL